MPCGYWLPQWINRCAICRFWSSGPSNTSPQFTQLKIRHRTPCTWIFRPKNKKQKSLPRTASHRSLRSWNIQLFFLLPFCLKSSHLSDIRLADLLNFPSSKYVTGPETLDSPSSKYAEDPNTLHFQSSKQIIIKPHIRIRCRALY